MKKIGVIFVVVLFAAVSSGCSTTLSGDDEAVRDSDGAKVDQMDAVVSGGNRQAVLSLHKRYAYANACKLGLTLTNNLQYKITNISFGFTAHFKGDVPDQYVVRNFFEIGPGAGEYREINFSGVTCDQVKFVEVTDPGRCAMGDLTRFASRPGDCIRHVYLAKTPYVKLVQK